MKHAQPSLLIRLAVLPTILLVAGCAYFNTFYNARNYYQEGLRLSEQNQVGPARDRFEKAIEKSAMVLSRWPDSRWADDATFLIGRSYYEMGQYGRSIRHFDQLALAFPESPLVPQSRYYRGLAMLRNREYGPARVLLDQVRDEHPELRDGAAYHLAASFYDREDWSRAADSLQKFLEQHPRSSHRPDALRRLIRSYENLGRWAECEQTCRELLALAIEPRERAETQLKLAETLIIQQNHSQALPIIRETIGRYRELDDKANILLGRALAETERTDEAVATWREVRGSTELGAEAFFRIGQFHERQRELELARAHYDTARLRRTQSEFGQRAASRLALLDAIARSDTAGERDPAEARFLVAEMHNLNLGEYDEARRLYRAVADSFPDSRWAPKALLAEAWIISRIENDSTGSLPILQRLIADHPDTEYADEARRWLGLPAPPRRPAEAIAELPPARSEPPAPPPRREPPPSPEELPDEPAPPEPPSPAPPPPPEPDLPVPPRDTVKPPPVPPERPARPAKDTTFRPVHFEFDRADIRQEDIEPLQRIAGWLRDNPSRRLKLTGHCDPRGPETYNLALGRQRARAVADFLTAAGIESQRLQIESRGQSDPVSTGPEDYWRDRRVEFHLL